jgi:glycosyltransferase
LNSSSTIRDTLTSIASQSYPCIEHIIIDGLSNDNTLKIIGEFPHVSNCISEKDAGIYYAMNKGIEFASGDVIGILNADDIYAHEHVLKWVMDLFENPSTDAVYGDLDFVDANDLTQIKRSWRSGTYIKESFYNGWMPPHPTFFVRTETYKKYGKFNTTLTSAADYELMLRFLLKNEIKPAYLQEVLVKMRLGGKSTGSIINRLIANREDRLAWRLNGLKPRFFTLILKPLRKINQFIGNG